MCGTKLYRTYACAKARCTCPTDHAYPQYWWRWIKFLWNSFEDFYRDMGVAFEEHIKKRGTLNTSLDRIDNNWNYCKENCRRATRAQQQNNTRYNKKIVYNGKEYPSIAVFCRELWLNLSRTRDRIKYGRDIEDIVKEWARRGKEILYKWKYYRTLRTLCKELNLKYWTIWKRINKDGLSLEDAITLPLHYK